MRPNAEIITCTVYRRETVPGGFRYRIENSWNTCYPPLVGDLIHLGEKTVRVLERAWARPAPGSMAFIDHAAHGAPLNHMLSLVAEIAEGPFVEEVCTEEEDS